MLCYLCHWRLDLFQFSSNLKILAFDDCENDAKIVESCCMLSTNSIPQSLGAKETKREPNPKSSFLGGQQVLCFLPKTHVLWNPKIPWWGSFSILKIHACGVINVLLNDRKLITVNGKSLKPYK